MESDTRIPHLLAPYISDIPKDSLILLTGTLGASTNWLIVRYLCGIFHNGTVRTHTEPATNDVGVVLVSWMRDYEFWRTETRKAGGLDVASLSQSRKFAFVDGLNIFSPPSRSSSTKLQSTDLSKTRTAIEATLSSLTSSSILLVLDAPDLLFALQDLSPTNSSFLLSLRLQARVHATMVSMASDITPDPMVSVAHQADLVISARGLDTGAAGDVSGVLRITKKGTGKEVLYLVKTDGGVRVWERGAGVG